MSLKESFYFQKSDRQVLLVALCLAAVALAVIWLVGDRNSMTPADDTAVADTAAMVAAGGDETAMPPLRLAPFDPNTADSTQLLALGLTQWQVRAIYRYRAKGGVYQQPEDFARLYGLTAKKYRELAPYIRISPDYRPASEVYGRRPRPAGGDRYRQAPYAYDRRADRRVDRPSSDRLSSDRRATGDDAPRHAADTLRYPVKLKPGEVIDLNTADTTLLKRVPGIGSYYARRVVYYREQLGGFCHTDQLFEIEGFPEEAADFFTCRPSGLRKINVNKLTLAQLRKHPYINHYQAKAITDYRRLKGPLRSLDDLSLLPDFSPEVIRRLTPYVEF